MPATKFRSLSARPYITTAARQRVGTRGFSARLDETRSATEAHHCLLHLPELHTGSDMNHANTMTFMCLFRFPDYTAVSIVL